MSFILQVLIFSCLPFFLGLLVLKSYVFSSKSHKNLPPSPPKLPLIGNLHQIGSSPHRALHVMAKTYGPLMLLRLGSVPVLVASSADAAREIMKTHDVIFANRAKLKLAGIIFYNCQDVAFSQYGERWRQLKSIAVLHLLSNKRVQSYQHVREDEMAFMIEKIHKAEKSLVNLSELVISLTNNVICRVALGRRYDGRDFKNLIQRTLELLGCFSVGSYIPWLSWVDRVSGLEEKAYAIAKEFDEFLELVIHEHLNKKGASGECQDIVDVLIELQRDDKTSFCLEKDMIKAIIL